MAWNMPASFATGEIVQPAKMNALRDSLQYLYDGHEAVDLAHNFDQNVSSGSELPLAFTGEILVSPASMHSNAAATRVVIPTAGFYLFYARATFSPSQDGMRRIDLRRNGVNTDNVMRATIWGAAPPNNTEVTLSGFNYESTPGTFYELIAFQDSGAPLVVLSGYGTPHLTALKVWR